MNKKRDKLSDGSRPLSLVDTEGWQIGEIQAGLADLDAEKVVSHGRVVRWLQSWGAARRTTPPATAVMPERLLAVPEIQ